MTTLRHTRSTTRRTTVSLDLLTTVGLALAPLPAHAAPSSAGTSGTALPSTAPAARPTWVTRDLSTEKAVDSVSITADGTVDLLRIDRTTGDGPSTEWTATLYRQSPSGTRTRVRAFDGVTAGVFPELRTGENGSSVLVVPADGDKCRASIWTRKNGSTRWTRTVAPKGASEALDADVQKNGTITVAYNVGRTLKTSTRKPGQKRWTTPRTVVTTPNLKASASLRSVHLDVTANGAATVAMRSVADIFDNDGKADGHLYLASRSAGTTKFGTATKASSTTVWNVAVAQAGAKSVASWTENKDLDTDKVYVRTRAHAKRAWGKRTTLATSVAGSPDGRATIVHTGHDGRATVRVLRRGGDTGFSKPVLSVKGSQETRLAQQHDGTVTLVSVVAGRTASTGKLVVRTSTKAGTRWSKPRTLGRSIVGGWYTLDLAVARGGATAVAWVAKTEGTGTHYVASHR
ncbi:hypothetical protein [Sanguibacter sp. HDW7]|uniref:hypothetical protein n=1 Tax=Sanguibacter sp. HDW7 TaxID=2714931 RepID=UPI00140938C5|nr:hypothetical protein [Sanguibacter sp. HDW7]QIK82325.1 hypothetical protein G7063_00870 [Sanguibacter sp. HDW7]